MEDLGGTRKHICKIKRLHADIYFGWRYCLAGGCRGRSGALTGNPSFIKSLKLQIGEDADYDKVIARYRSEGLGDSWTKDMKIIPVNFNKEHKAMLGHCKMILENEGGRIAINPDKFDKLITALRTAVDNDGTFDKESTSYNDIFDAFRLALKFYHYEESS